MLQDEEVKHFLYNLLLKFKKTFQIKIFDYVFMDSHFHMLLYISSTEQLSAFMRRVFGSLAVFINKRTHRSGRVFGDRARTPVIQDKGYFLSTMFYIANNPVRANMVVKAKDYKWSGYGHYAYGKPNALIDDAPEYLALSNVAAIRRKEFQKLANLPFHRHERQKPEYVSWFFIGDRDWILSMMVNRGFIRPKKPPG
jgi:putative transposase